VSLLRLLSTGRGLTHWGSVRGFSSPFALRPGSARVYLISGGGCGCLRRVPDELAVDDAAGLRAANARLRGLWRTGTGRSRRCGRSPASAANQAKCLGNAGHAHPANREMHITRSPLQLPDSKIGETVGICL
jgi:hypothetical protein